MNYFSWDTIADDAENIVEIVFCGEKASSNDEPFMTALAPFVDSGSYIGMVGEDSTLWACVSDEKNRDDWSAQVKAILEQHRECLAVGLDCHI